MDIILAPVVRDEYKLINHLKYGKMISLDVIKPPQYGMIMSLVVIKPPVLWNEFKPDYYQAADLEKCANLKTIFVYIFSNLC